MNNFLPFAFLQGKFVKFEDANLSIATHALHYGTAAFGGLRGIVDPSDSNQILLFRLDKHANRFSQSAKFLHYDLSSEYFIQKIVEFVKINKPSAPFYIRPLVYTSDLGIAPRLHNVEKDFLIYGMELGDYLSPDGVSCRFSSWQRQADISLPLRGKISGAYITSSLAKTEAVESGFDEAILLNSKGKVSEGTGMNLFLIRDNVLITPGVDEDILEGITRNSILTIAKDMGIAVLERSVDKTELFIADEVFLSGTAAKIAPVKKIENYNLSENHPITDSLRIKLNEISQNLDEQYQDWIWKVKVG